MKSFWIAIVIVVGLATQALAQEAPAPRKSPHTPVNRQTLADRRAPSAPPSRDINGTAIVLDGEKLRIGDLDLRLFGVVPPQLSANFGPQARTALDTVIAGQPVACHIRDRDKDGRLLATCHAHGGVDLGLELLRRGLAVAARGSLADTEFAEPYRIAETAAQNNRLGLWSQIAPAQAPLTTAAPTSVAVLPPAPVPTSIEVRKPDVKKDDGIKTTGQELSPTPLASSTASAVLPITTAAPTVPTTSGFFARYQILIASLLMLTTALSILAVFVVQRWHERREEMRALAAALRGELLAARAVCNTRLRSLTSEADDQAMVWPRLRATLYQAYVGRLGWLGAELARQIASIYGQTSDYAAYYATTGEAATMPKRQALQTLINHIEEVLPRLSRIEHTGHRPTPSRRADATLPPPPSTLSASPTLPLSPTPPLEITGTVEPPTSELNPSSERPPESATQTTNATLAVATTALTAVAAMTTANPNLGDTQSSTSHSDPSTGPTDLSPHALWDSLRRFARDHFTSHSAEDNDPMTDYAALIEQDIANMSFEDDDPEQPINPPIRKTGSQ